MSQEIQLRTTLRDLLKWERQMGGFEAPAWDRARHLIAAQSDISPASSSHKVTISGRQTIATKYHGPAAVKGSRVSARSSSGLRVVVEWDDGLNREQNHAAAARALCARLGWADELVGGDTRDGMVWVLL